MEGKSGAWTTLALEIDFAAENKTNNQNDNYSITYKNFSVSLLARLDFMR